MADMLTYIRNMTHDELKEFLYNGGFCPEKACDEPEEEATEIGFGIDKSGVMTCEAGIGSELCRVCIGVFLDEEAPGEK